MRYAAPLYILREQCQSDLFGTLTHLRDIGFDGVEFLGFFGHAPDEIGQALRKLQLVPVGNHVDYDAFVADPSAVIAAHRSVGCRYVTIGGWFHSEYDASRLAAWAENVTRIGRMCREAGLTLLYHNHHNELKQHGNGVPLLRLLMDAVPSDALALEPDLGWMGIAGASPREYLETYQDRIPVLHVKDYYCEDPIGAGVPGDVLLLGTNRGGAGQGFFEFRPTGYGIMNYSSLMKHMLACHSEWMVLDHDLAYERNPFHDLSLSLDYMRSLMGMTPA